MRWILIAAVLLTGCSRPKAFVEITKSPVKIVYVDYEKEITPQVVQSLLRQASKVPFDDTVFTSGYNLTIDYDAQMGFLY